MLRIRDIKYMYNKHMDEVQECSMINDEDDTEYIPKYTYVALVIVRNGTVGLELTSPIPWNTDHSTTFMFSDERDITIADLKKAHRIIGILSR